MTFDTEPLVDLSKIESRVRYKYQMSDANIHHVISMVEDDMNINYIPDFIEYERKRDMKYYLVQKFVFCIETYKIKPYDLLFKIAKMEVNTRVVYNKKILAKTIYALCYSINNILDNYEQVAGAAELNIKTLGHKFKSLHEHLDTIILNKGRLDQC